MSQRRPGRAAPLVLAFQVWSAACARAALAAPAEPGPLAAPAEPGPLAESSSLAEPRPLGDAGAAGSAPVESCRPPHPVDALAVERVARARRHHARALAHYDAGDHEAALREFERAYALSPAYQLLFNLGQLEYRLGRRARARQHLEAYLRQGGACIAPERRAEVAAELATLPPAPAEPPTAHGATPAAPERELDPKASVAWISAGVLGAGALGAGLGTLLAVRRHDELRAEPALEGEATSARARLERQRALVQRLSLATDVLAVAAVGAAALGLYWTLSSGAEAPGAPLALELGPRGAQLSGSF